MVFGFVLETCEEAARETSVRRKKSGGGGARGPQTGRSAVEVEIEEGFT